jgi:hypothetical protein
LGQVFCARSFWCHAASLWSSPSQRR